MPRDALTSIPKSYADLRRGVEAALRTGRLATDEATVRASWQTGRLIHEHVLLFQDRAGYGAKVFRPLSDDTGASERTLYECGHFYRCFPIPRHVAK